MPAGFASRSRAQHLADALDGVTPANASVAALVATAGRLQMVPLAPVPYGPAGRAAAMAAFSAAGAGLALHAAAGAAVGGAAHGGSAGSAAGGLAGAVAGHGVALAVVTGVAVAAVAAAAVTAEVTKPSHHHSPPPAVVTHSTAPTPTPSASTPPSVSPRTYLNRALAAVKQIQALAAGPQTPTTQAQIAALIRQVDADIEAASGPLMREGLAGQHLLAGTLDMIQKDLGALPGLGAAASSALGQIRATIGQLSASLPPVIALPTATPTPHPSSPTSIRPSPPTKAPTTPPPTPPVIPPPITPPPIPTRTICITVPVLGGVICTTYPANTNNANQREKARAKLQSIRRKDQQGKTVPLPPGVFERAHPPGTKHP